MVWVWVWLWRQLADYISFNSGLSRNRSLQRCLLRQLPLLLPLTRLECRCVQLQLDKRPIMWPTLKELLNSQEEECILDLIVDGEFCFSVQPTCCHSVLYQQRWAFTQGVVIWAVIWASPFPFPIPIPIRIPFPFPFHSHSRISLPTSSHADDAAAKFTRLYKYYFFTWRLIKFEFLY